MDGSGPSSGETGPRPRKGPYFEFVRDSHPGLVASGQFPGDTLGVCPVTIPESLPTGPLAPERTEPIGTPEGVWVDKGQGAHRGRVDGPVSRVRVMCRVGQEAEVRSPPSAPSALPALSARPFKSRRTRNTVCVGTGKLEEHYPTFRPGYREEGTGDEG